ncbi:MAG: GAF domain-containing SpoIIE family protein phosphatase [Acidimicrobiales bacterium]
MGRGVPPAVHAPGRLDAVAATGLVDTEPEESFDRLVRLAATFLEAPLAFFTLVDAEYSWYKAVTGLAPGAPRCDVVESSFCKYVIGSGQAVVIGDARVDARTIGNPAIEAMGVVAWAGFPVLDGDGFVLGSFCVVDTVARRWSETQIEALRVLSIAAADQVSLRRALRAERQARTEAELARAEIEALRGREQHLVELFQRSLFPATLPVIPGLSTAVRYAASNDAADIGGDWYDLIKLPSGDTGLVVGDVCGHDLPAVAVMAQLRHSLHVLASQDLKPAHIMSLLDQMMVEQEIERFATVGYAVWCATTSEVTLTSAGHPPPLMLRAGGGADFLLEGRHPLLGLGLVEITDGQVASLNKGDTLVLFTDGLFEAPGVSIDEGLERLRTLAAAHVDTDPETLCDALLDGMRPDQGWRDDVALLVAHHDG